MTKRARHGLDITRGLQLVWRIAAAHGRVDRSQGIMPRWASS